MSHLHIGAGVTFLVSGTLVLSFGLFSVLGTLVGGVMAAAGGATGATEDAVIGAFMFVLYAVFMIVGLSVGVMQLVGGVLLLRGRQGPWLWVVTFASLLPMLTVYCAMPSLVAFVVGLVVLLTAEPGSELADSR